MTLNEYQQKAARTINGKLDNTDLVKHSLLGLASEVGETCGIFQKEYQGHAVKLEKVVEEIGDIFWFAAELCTALGISMDEVAERNINKLFGRYKNGFTESESVNRVEYKKGGSEE